MATKASILHPPNETEHTMSRVTQEGKKLTYHLKVIQQPERARACGAGAKSSADRRPVDPPPVVELRVYESDLNDQHKTDVTFSYNANFFLFATLEWARPIAHGRVQTQTPSCPVLTGVPVAGIAYLDRPTQAGYFIFPDLSVRHEGLYRLNFNLYEEMKEPKHADKGGLVPHHPQHHLVPSTPSKPRSPHQFLHFRLVVKSVPFTVYSAKKFPGLAESTTLSRIVAEQGCRVRIRRDVRMRRREPKPNKDYGAYDDRHRATPDPYPGTPIERPRSTSNASIDDPYRYPTAPPQVQPSPDSALTSILWRPCTISRSSPATTRRRRTPRCTIHCLSFSPSWLRTYPTNLWRFRVRPPRAKIFPVPTYQPSLGCIRPIEAFYAHEPINGSPPYQQMSYDQRLADPKLYNPPSQLHHAPPPPPQQQQQQQHQHQHQPPPSSAAVAQTTPHRTPAKPTILPPTPSCLSVEIDPAAEADDTIFSATRTRRGWVLDEKPGPAKRTRDTSEHDHQPLRNGQRPVMSGDERGSGELSETSGGSDDEVMMYRRADGRTVWKHRASANSKGKEVNTPRDLDLVPRRAEVCPLLE
ncbi:sexual development activator VeA [Blastomyces dermatitidis ATCC 18188]|uniref:Sexual development activator VeA n=1 Tax=Ajellomyces dermatitidis (strain ATCC 18188 / CBS 674.68) TaxID=653446 RepID=F2T7N9_AJEDA|nr:sexual development activator VeA [Blastomyces dermatitidis ATCC 18188]